MPTEPKWEAAKEKKRLLKMYYQLRKIVEATLERMGDDPEKVSSALLDTAVKAIRQMNDLVDQLERSRREVEAQLEADRIREEVHSRLPSHSKQQQGQDSDFNQGMTLPFPKLLTGQKEIK